jgi:hypothetical protein
MIAFDTCPLHPVFIPRNVNLFIGLVWACPIYQDGGDTEVP